MRTMHGPIQYFGPCMESVIEELGPPLPCMHLVDYWGEGDCEYPAGGISCDDCAVHGGPLSPETGKNYRWPARYLKRLKEMEEAENVKAVPEVRKFRH